MKFPTKSSRKISYTIVIGALNEERYIQNTLKELSKYLKKIGIWSETEVVVVVPPGNDKTLQVTKKLLSSKLFCYDQLIRPKKRIGKGRDIRLGILASRGDYISFFDADRATPLRHLDKLFTRLKSGETDVVFGKRSIWRMHNNFLRNLNSGFSNIVTRVFAGVGIRDSQCGFKGFKRNAAMTIFTPLETEGWAFDIEAYVRARTSNLTLEWLEINDWKDPKSKQDGLGGETQVEAMLSTGKSLVKILLNRLTGHYLPPERQRVYRGSIKSAAVALVWFMLLHVVFLVGFGLLSTDQPNVNPQSPGLFQAVNTFDSPFYTEIAQSGYTGTGSVKHLAFYPLYPLILRFAQTVSLHTFELQTLAFIINAMCVLAVAGILYRISYRLKLKRPHYAVIAWLLFPWSFFMGALYTEALFSLLIAGCVLSVMNKKWYVAAVIAGLASFTRLPGTMLGVLLLFEYVRQSSPQVLNRNNLTKQMREKFMEFTLLALIAFSGIACWLGYQWYEFGSPLAFQEAYSTLWDYQVFSLNIFAPLYESTKTAIIGLMNNDVKAELFEVGTWLFALGVSGASIQAKLKIPKGWYAFILLNLTLILLNSNTVSINRYILPLIMLYPMLILLFERLPRRLNNTALSIYLCGGVIIQLYMAIRLVNFAWVG